MSQQATERLTDVPPNVQAELDATLREIDHLFERIRAHQAAIDRLKSETQELRALGIQQRADLEATVGRLRTSIPC